MVFDRMYAAAEILFKHGVSKDVLEAKDSEIEPLYNVLYFAFLLKHPEIFSATKNLHADKKRIQKWL